jgi:hypothetical protein
MKAMVVNGGKIQRRSAESRDEKKRSLLWEASSLLVNLADEEKALFVS